MKMPFIYSEPKENNIRKLSALGTNETCRTWKQLTENFGRASSVVLYGFVGNFVNKTKLQEWIVFIAFLYPNHAF